MPRSSSTWTNGSFSTTTGKFSTALRKGGGGINQNQGQATISLPNGVTVDDNLVRTVEFWFKNNLIGVTGRSAKFVSSTSISSAGYPNTSHLTLVIYNNGNLYLSHPAGGGSEYNFGNVGTGWHHMVWQYNGTGNFRCWLDGVHKISATHSISGFSSLNFAQTWTYSGDGPLSSHYCTIDEVRISSVNRYTHSATNFTPPTTAFTNDADTLALFHMESTSQTDDTQDPITEGSATLNTSFSITCDARVIDLYFEEQYTEQDYTEGDPAYTDYIYDGYVAENYTEGDAVTGTTQDASASLSAAFTITSNYTVLIIVTGIELVMSNNVISITYSRIRPTDSNITVSGSVSFDDRFKIANADSTINAQFNQTCNNEKIVQGNITITDAMSVNLTATALKNHDASMDVNVSISATVSKFTGAEETLDNIISLSLQGIRQRSYQSTITSQASLAITYIVIKQTSSTQNITASLTANAVVIKNVDSVLNVSASVSATFNNIKQFGSNINTQFTVTCDFAEIEGFTVNMDTAFTISTDNTRLRYTDSSVTGTFTLTEGVGILFRPEFQTNNEPDTDSLDAVFTQTSTADRLRGVDADVTAQFTQNTDNTRQRVGDATITAQFSNQSDVGTIQQGSATFNNAYTPSIDATVTRNSTAILDVSFTQQSDVNRFVGIVSSMSVQASNITQAQANKPASAQLQSAVTVQAVVNAFVPFGATLESAFVGRNGGEFLAKQSVLTRSTQIEIKNSGIFQTRFRIDSNTKQFGAGSLAEDYVSPPANTDLRDSVLYNQTVWDGTYYWQIGKGYSHYSTDGINWSRSTNNLSFQPLTIEYLNSKIVTIDNANRTIYHSTNGTTFTSVSANMSATRTYNTFDIQYFNGHYIFQSSEYNSSTNTTQIYFHYYNSSFTSVGTKRYSFTYTYPSGQIVFAGEYNGKLYYVINDGAYFDDNINFQRIKPIQISYVNSTITFTDADQFIFNNTGSTPTGITTSSGTGWSVQDSVIDSSGVFYFTLLHTVTGERATASGYTFNQGGLGNLGSSVNYLKWFEFTNTNQPSVWTRYLYIVNGVFVMPTNHGYYTATNWADLGSNPAIDLADVPQLTFYKFISFANSKYFLQANGRFHITSDITSAVDWTVSDLDVDDRVADITVRSGATSTARLSDFKTFETWIRVEPNTNFNNGQIQREIFFYTDSTASTFRIFYSASQSKMAIQMLTGKITGTGTTQTNLTTGFVFDANQWYHMRYVYDNTGQSLFVNGSRVATSTDVPLFNTEKSLVLRHQPTFASETAFLDDFRLYNTQLSAVSDTTYTVPTAPFENDSNTLLLMNFDTAIEDNSEFQIVEQADLDVTATVTAPIEYAVGNLSAVINSTASLTVTTEKIKNATANITAQADVSTAISITRTAQSSISSSADFTVIYTNIRPGAGALDTTATLTASVGKINQADADLDAFNSVLSAVGKIGDFLIALDNNIAVTITAQKTVELIKQLDNAVNVQTDASITRTAQSDMVNAVTASITADRFRGLDDTLETAVTSDFVVHKNVLGTTDITAQFTVVAQTLPIRETPANLQTQITLSVDADFTASIQQSIQSEFTITIDAGKTAAGASAITTASTMTDLISVIRGFESEFDAVAITLNVVHKIGRGLIGISTVADIVTVPEVIRSATLNIDAVIDAVIDDVRVRFDSASINSTFTANIIGFVDYEIYSQLTVAANNSSTVQKIVDPGVVIDNAVDFVVEARLTKTTETELINTISLSVDVERFRLNEVNLTNVISIQADAGYRVDVTLAIESAVTLSANFRTIQLDELVYVIPAEDKEYKIKAETREFTIDRENRTYTVKT